MRYETFSFIMANKNAFKYDNATSGGSDTSTDSSASSINPNNTLVPEIGIRKIKRFLVFILLILAILYLFKHI